MSDVVDKLWSYCHLLRDDGLSYQDYLEQLTFLLFLEMADERARLTGEEQAIPAGFRWADLAAPQMEGVELARASRPRPGDRRRPALGPRPDRGRAGRPREAGAGRGAARDLIHLWPEATSRDLE